MVKYRAVAVAVAVAVSGGGAVAVAVAVAGLTKRFFNHIQKDFLINVLNQDVRISIFNVIRTKWQGYRSGFAQKLFGNPWEIVRVSLTDSLAALGRATHHCPHQVTLPFST